MKDQISVRLLKALMKNSRLSDREMAKLIESSQPTVTRKRKKLEKDGYIKSYTVVPDFERMGYKILAFTFGRMKSYPSSEEAREIKRQAAEWVGKRPNVIFAADGEGLGGKDVVMVSFHKGYKEYAEFMRTYALDWGHTVNVFETFLVSIGSEFTMKPLDLRYLAEDK